MNQKKLEARDERLAWSYRIFVIIVICLIGYFAKPQSKSTLKLSSFFELPNQIQAAKEAYAEAYDIPADASLTVKQLDEVLTPFYATHPRNAEGNFVSDDPREFIEVPRQVNKQPGTVFQMYWLKKE